MKYCQASDHAASRLLSHDVRETKNSDAQKGRITMKILQKEAQYLEMYGDKYLEQIALEAESKREAEELLKASMERVQREGTIANTTLGQKLTDTAWETCRNNVQALIDVVKAPKRGAVSKHTPLLKQLINIYDDAPAELVNLLTLASLTEALNTSLKGRSSVSQVADRIITAVLDESSIHAYLKHVATKRHRIFSSV